jgi:hypothetical protein
MFRVRKIEDIILSIKSKGNKKKKNSFSAKQPNSKKKLSIISDWELCAAFPWYIAFITTYPMTSQFQPVVMWSGQMSIVNESYL